VKLSIVSTLFRSEATIEEFVKRARKAASRFGGSYEIVLVNDGSPDQSREIVLGLAQKKHDIVLIDLSRNFGQHEALFAGIQHARGELIFTIDADLEEDPAWLEPLYSKLQADNADLVCGVQHKRKGGFLEKITGAGFYVIFNKLSRTEVLPNATVARVFTKRFAKALTAYDERTIFLPGLFAYTGFKQSSIKLHKHHTDPTSYSLNRRFSLAINAITSFSSRPLQYIFALGALIVSLVISAAIGLSISWVFFGALPSIAIIILLSVWFLGGIIISTIGLLGFYLARVFDEVKRRPNTIVREIHDFTQASIEE